MKLQEMKRTELLQAAKKAGLTGYSRLRKAELVKLLSAHVAPAVTSKPVGPVKKKGIDQAKKRIAAAAAAAAAAKVAAPKKKKPAARVKPVQKKKQKKKITAASPAEVKGIFAFSAPVTAGQVLAESALSSPPPLPPPAEKREVFIDYGLPIPDQYGDDWLQAMVEGPHLLFAYWEMSGGTYAALRDYWGADNVSGGSWYLCGRDPGSNRELFRAAVGNRGGRYYYRTRPLTTLQFVILVRLADGRDVDVMTANIVTTPRATPSDRTDEEWFITEEEFARFFGGGEFDVPSGRPGKPIYSGTVGRYPTSWSGAPSSPSAPWGKKK